MQSVGQLVCALGAEGGVYCWGDNTDGRLGNGETPERQLDAAANVIANPTRVVGIADAVAIGLGVTHACALTKQGAVSCWGESVDGQLGVADLRATGKPVTTIAAGARVLAVSYFQSCAILLDRSVTCWGHDLPDETGRYRPVPVPTPVPGLTNAISLEVDRDETCAVTASNERRCWHSSWETAAQCPRAECNPL